MFESERGEGKKGEQGRSNFFERGKRHLSRLSCSISASPASQFSFVTFIAKRKILSLDSSCSNLNYTQMKFFARNRIKNKTKKRISSRSKTSNGRGFSKWLIPRVIESHDRKHLDALIPQSSASPLESTHRLYERFTARRRNER